MTYNEAVSWLQTMLEIPLNQTDVNFQRLVPLMFPLCRGAHLH